MEEKEILLEILAYVKNFDVRLENAITQAKEEMKQYVEDGMIQTKEEMKLYVDTAIEKNTKEIAAVLREIMIYLREKDDKRISEEIQKQNEKTIEGAIQGVETFKKVLAG